MRYRLRVPALLAVAILAPLFAGCERGVTNPGASATQTAAATPDLSGVWRRSRRPPDNSRQYTIFELAMSLTNEEPPMTPWAEAKFKANKPNIGPNAVSLAKSNDPVISCFPPGVPRIYLQRGEPLEILQVPGRVIMFFEYDHFVRQIYTDGRQHPKDLAPTWMGDSIGKWDGDTLVVDTVGFNDKTWLDLVGHPHTEAMHLVERIRRVSHDALTIDFLIDDPKAYTKPWGTHAIFDLKPGWNIGELACEDNGTFGDLQKKTEAGK
jgi:hypothetical protein